MRRLQFFSGLLMLVGQAQASGSAFTIPTRISRAIFEQPISARVNSQPTSVQWSEEDSEELEASAEKSALVAFRDHVGCAEFPELAAPMKLCFKVQGDVSSLTLNADQMWIQGQQKKPRFVSATKNDAGFSVQFRGDAGILRVQITRKESNV